MAKKRVFVRMAVFAGLSVVLFSCVIPEKFTCNIAVDKQGAYSVDFKGTLLYFLVLDEVEKQGKVSEATDKQIKAGFDEAVAKEPAVKKYEYRNSGRGYIRSLAKLSERW
jgi:hypothetical protein